MSCPSDVFPSEIKSVKYGYLDINSNHFMELGTKCSDTEKLQNNKKAVNRMFSVDCLLSYGGGAENRTLVTDHPHAFEGQTKVTP